MKYQITLSNGDQSIVESELCIGEFARDYPLTADILVIQNVSESAESKPVAKRKKVTQDAE